jgi:ATP-dependent DNA helicase RecQ
MAVDSASIDLAEALQTFGLSDFRRGQREVIEHVISGRDCLCVMPTGGGKSLCYQLPSVVRPGLTIVVSPLIALMKDQVDSLLRRGIRATLINSSLTLQEQTERLEQVASGRFTMLYVAPERMRNSRFLDSIRATPIQLLAVDEAHCISEWGHDFRPDYQRLGRFREALGNVQTIALTATATPKVRDDILSSLNLQSAKTFITGFARDNLYFGSLYCMSDRDKDKHLHRFLEGRDESGIIYVATRKRCDALVDQLAKELKLSVGSYHAGLLPEQRKHIQDQFMTGKLKAIVATNAFGMGIDKPDLRYVIHYNMPGTIEAYYQEAGRAGRDGLLSQCVLFYNPQDRYIQEFFIENANPSRAIIESVYQVLQDCEDDPIEMTADEIRDAIGKTASAEAVNASLQILARTNVLERLEVAGGLAMFRLSSRMPSYVDLLPRDARVRRSVLQVLERGIGDRRDEPVYIHPRWLMDQLQMDRDTLFRHLNELTKLEDFEFAKPFRGRAIHFRRRNVPFDELPIDHEGLAVRKKADFEKLDQMVAYAKTTRCRQRTILDYFGDTTAGNCRICDRCQGKTGWPKLPVVAKIEAKAKPITEAKVTSADIPKKTASKTEETTPKKREGSKKQTAPAKEVSPQDIRDAAALIQTVLGAIERTHGYLSKTILTQFFSGTASKGVSGLRLQRLAEFGLLKHWKKSHSSGLMDVMLNQEVVHQSEMRLGKQTVAITELGTQCCAAASHIPKELLEFVIAAMTSATAMTSNMPNEREAMVATSAEAPNTDISTPHTTLRNAGTTKPAPTTAVSHKAPATATRDPSATTELSASSESPLSPASSFPAGPFEAHPQGTAAAPPARMSTDTIDADIPRTRPTTTESVPTKPAPTKPPASKAAPTPPSEATIRSESELPAVAIGDAANVSTQRSLLNDWQWTLRLVRHGYRLGECALIRGRTPDAILSDLIYALENREKFPIDQLFDRRTTLAIEELKRSQEVPKTTPSVLQSFPSLWPMVLKWIELRRNSPG